MRLFTLLLIALAAAPLADAQSLFADPKANRPGDILTIVLAERADAQRASRYQDESSARMGGSGSVGSNTFGADAQFSQEADARNNTAQSDLLTGTLTALVTGLDEAGNLTVAGERSINVNGVTHVMKVTGSVRMRDIRYDNTVLSYQIANAQIEYRRAGKAARFLKPATLVRAGAVVLLGLAAFFVAG